MSIDTIISALLGGIFNAATFKPIISKACTLTIDILDANNDFTTSLFNNSIVISFIAFIETVGGIFFLFGIGFAFSEWAIDCNEGNGTSTMLATLKNSFIGLAATLGFASLPILLLKFMNDITYTLCNAMTGANLKNTMSNMSQEMEAMEFFSGWGGTIFAIIILVCVIRVFLANLKRGGILITLITVGSLHMFSIPRGYTDAFWSWCKQVIGLSLTSFLQNLLLILGIVVYAGSNIDTFDLILGAGVMLSATEVPRILQQFGLDTSMKTNVSQAIYGASGIMNIASAFAK